jgi:hypothetical protein
MDASSSPMQTPNSPGAHACVEFRRTLVRSSGCLSARSTAARGLAVPSSRPSSPKHNPPDAPACVWTVLHSYQNRTVCTVPLDLRRYHRTLTVKFPKSSIRVGSSWSCISIYLNSVSKNAQSIEASSSRSARASTRSGVSKPSLKPVVDPRPASPGPPGGAPGAGAGWQGDERIVRYGYAAAAALNGLGLAGIGLPALSNQNIYPRIERVFRQPVADIFLSWGRFWPDLLDLGDEAERLLADLDQVGRAL